MSVDIMPLVEENRKLHDQLRAVKAEMEQQQVRWDEYLTQAPTVKNAVAYVEVQLGYDEILVIDQRDKLHRLMESRLAEALGKTKPFYTVKDVGGSVTYRFAIFAGKK